MTPTPSAGGGTRGLEAQQLHGGLRVENAIERAGSSPPTRWWRTGENGPDGGLWTLRFDPKSHQVIPRATRRKAPSQHPAMAGRPARGRVPKSIAMERSNCPVDAEVSAENKMEILVYGTITAWRWHCTPGFALVYASAGCPISPTGALCAERFHRLERAQHPQTQLPPQHRAGHGGHGADRPSSTVVPDPGPRHEIRKSCLLCIGLAILEVCAGALQGHDLHLPPLSRAASPSPASRWIINGSR